MEDNLISTTYTIPLSHKERLEKEAKRLDRSASSIIRHLIIKYLERLDAKNHEDDDESIDQ